MLVVKASFYSHQVLKQGQTSADCFMFSASLAYLKLKISMVLQMNYVGNRVILRWPKFVQNWKQWHKKSLLIAALITCDCIRRTKRCLYYFPSGERTKINYLLRRGNWEYLSPNIMLSEVQKLKTAQIGDNFAVFIFSACYQKIYIIKDSKSPWAKMLLIKINLSEIFD